MRIALIVLDTPGNGTVVRFAGRSVAAVQLDIALAAGCSRILCLGPQLDKAALELQQRAERAGAGFVLMSGLRGLLGAASGTDEVLVFANAVFPDRRVLLDQIAAPAVLALPAESAVPKGFERIDADSAWSGVALVRGNTVERLAQLPDDSEPASALLRAALQAGTPRVSLDDDMLARGTWLAAPTQQQLDELVGQASRQAAQFSAFSAPGTAVAERLAARLWYERGGSDSGGIMPLGAMLAGVGGVVVAALEMPVLTFVLLGLAASLATMGAVYGRIGSQVLGDPGSSRLAVMARRSLDPLIAAGFAFAAPEYQDWLRLYVPLVMVLALHLASRYARPDWRAPFTDRIALSVLAIPAAWFGVTQALAAFVTMIALVMLSLSLPQGRD